MKNLKKYRSTITVSLLVGIFIFYISPILSFIGDQFVEFLLYASDKFSDDYYESLAVNNPYVFAETTNYIASLGSVSFLFWYLIYLKIKRNDLKEGVAKILADIKSMQDELERKKEQLTKDERLEKLNRVKISALSQKSRLDKRDNALIGLSITTIFYAVAIFYTFALKTSVTHLNIEFRNQTIILLPHLGQEKINEIKSEWSQMKNSDDYEVINTKITEFENKYIK
jgi:hypothetical protein